MTQQTWHDSLESELKKQRLPKKYVRRYLAELSAHAEDLRNGRELEEGAFIARIGEPAKLARQAGESYRASCFARRHPVWLYVTLSIPLAALVMLDICVLGNAIDWLGKWAGRPFLGPGGIFALRYALGLALCYLPGMVGAGILAKSNRDYGVNKRWSLASAVLLGAFAMCWAMRHNVSRDGTDRFMFLLAYPFTFYRFGNRWLQFATPILTWLAYHLWRSRKESPRIVAKHDDAVAFSDAA